ncbi:condensin complex subunit SMC2 [Pluteus cervinus]|uniref:Condensin complex subunit SMC2 n=1 Tax=Pluteus cervinus TaxID=181527 RepID=A0ACD3B1B1_9AGAR|nr:condensin complex subunit SMC2 [Pluteus cervinus]
MRIEELVIEGFKSYPVRTQITGWDSSFNAITGLNGSGKSNILDAICFVLGITNMATMRAANQQDLIYKRGQAGVTKASVTIVFDNSDRLQSPVGFEDCKQITVTRQIALPNITKYLLNGHKAQQQQIQGLFQSVQLNINNPNFVIMQGRITKVLNMRPQEILGMVEEAAGTRMFEDRKDKAKRTMTKKDKKIDEITALLQEEITPKLEKLRNEKRSYLAYQKSVTELERIGRVLRAWEWTDARDKVEQKTAEIEAKHAEKKTTAEAKKRANKEAVAAEKDAEQVVKKRDEEMKKGGKLKRLEDEVTELGKALAKVRTQADIKEGTIRDETTRGEEINEELKELDNSRTAKQAQLDKLTSSYNAIKDKHDALQTSLTTAEELLQTLLTGLGGNANAAGGGYMGQLAEARQRAAQAAAEEEQARVKLNMTRTELAEVEKKWKSVEKEAGDGKKKVEAMKREVDSLRKRIESSGWSDEQEKNSEGQLQQVKAEVRDLTQRREGVRQALANLDFQYESPHPRFDRNKVKGRAGLLISLEEKNYHAATALEIAAGGKLYNVVVEDERVGKDLLQPGKLRKRVTIIPLNKINAFKISSQKLTAAQRVAPGKVRPALSLVGYADEVAAAMAFVFSDTLICDDSATAKAVTFHPEVQTRSVTLDGDVYDPSGTLTGGAAPSSSGILVRVQELLEVEGKLQNAQERMQALEGEMSGGGRGVRDTWKQLKRELEMKLHEVGLLEAQVEGSNAARLGTQVDNLKRTIDELITTVQTAKDKQKAAKDECAKLEKDMAEFKNNKEGKIDELKADISRQKAALQKHAVIVKTQQKECQTANLEHEQLKVDIEGAKKNQEELKAGIAKLQKELGKQKEEVAKSEADHAKAERKLQEERATLSRFDAELKELEKVIKGKKQQAADADLKISEIEHSVVTLEKEKTTASNMVANLEKQYDWIQEDKDQFGREGSKYDFDAMEIGTLRVKADELESSQRGMKKKINPKVLSMIDNVEKRDAGLRKMMATVLKDKEKIEGTIEELDRYKRDALQKTWEKVDKDFGGIFAELLPGNFAKLRPPEGQDLTDGLEVKVQLGTVWKQSLTELSGGQRSLIALSLIMALLQFKPAPMYILDEIDAALDLSHTQHIGQLFRTRFKGSQFIVVSLKEGLFTNANVLFRARFRDGTSVVDRTAQRSASGLYEENDRDEHRARRGR